MRGPQISGESFGILERFVFGESRNVEVRGDFANAINQAGRGDPVGDVTSPLLGRITGAAYGPRNIRLEVRI